MTAPCTSTCATLSLWTLCCCERRMIVLIAASECILTRGVCKDCNSVGLRRYVMAEMLHDYEFLRIDWNLYVLMERISVLHVAQ